MSRKRSTSVSPEPSCSSTKRLKVEEDPDNHICDIIKLSDDVLLEIMKNIGSLDLFHLGQCCQRFNRLMKDWSLWEKVDLMERPMKVDELLENTHMFRTVTKSIAITAGHYKDNREISEIIHLVAKSCPRLTELTMENYVIDTLKVQINHFPSSLVKLSLKGTNLESDLPPRTPFFTKLDLYMPNLTCLILSNCNWVQSQSLLPLSKLPKLKELRLNSCRQFCECVAYASLAARFGFKALEILDVRKTALGDSDISSFSFTTSLTHLYLENYVNEGESAQDDLDEAPTNAELPFLGGQRVYEDENLVEIIPNGRVELLNDFRPGVITDRSIRTLSIYREENNRQDGQPPVSSNPNLKVLVIRNYPRVTNSSLIHLLLNAPPSFEYLDVTGTSVTKDCVDLFRLHRKNVKLVSSFDTDCND